VCGSWLWPTEVKFGAANGLGFSVRGGAIVKFSVRTMKLCRFVVLDSFDEFLLGLKWLCGHEVLVRSDHGALLCLLTSGHLSSRWARCLDILFVEF
jgi:hypothetical protein